jgi:hypothetical protein
VEATRERLRSRALLLAYATIGYNVLEAAVAIAAGGAAGSPALLSFGGDLWHFAVRWTPEVSRPPEHLLKKPCPVCGCPLEAAPAVQCLCGRWTHLQNPDVPDDPEALNCFLHAEKCQCQRKSSLAPLVEPELPESLASGNSQDEW